MPARGGSKVHDGRCGRCLVRPCSPLWVPRTARGQIGLLAESNGSRASDRLGPIGRRIPIMAKRWAVSRQRCMHVLRTIDSINCRVYQARSSRQPADTARTSATAGHELHFASQPGRRVLDTASHTCARRRPGMFPQRVNIFIAWCGAGDHDTLLQQSRTHQPTLVQPRSGRASNDRTLNDVTVRSDTGGGSGKLGLAMVWALPAVPDEKTGACLVRPKASPSQTRRGDLHPVRPCHRTADRRANQRHDLRSACSPEIHPRHLSLPARALSRSRPGGRGRAARQAGRSIN